MAEPVLVQSYDLKTFNSLYGIRIKSNMKVEQVHQQLEGAFTIDCRIVATSKSEALQKVLSSMNEYIINIEDIFFLCIRPNENS